jgi:hypothetical protein
MSLHQRSKKTKLQLPVETMDNSQKRTFEPPFFERVGIGLFRHVNKHIPWYKLPGLLGAINLAFLRVELRASNLHDGYASASAHQGNAQDVPLEDERFRHARHSDGKFNSLEMPLMGCAGIRFGRNFPRSACQRPTEEELWTPNPRVVSERFMKRTERGFIPATTLNLLAAAWIQFQTHDWFNHETVSFLLSSSLFCSARMWLSSGY